MENVDAYRQTHRALCVYGEIKRTKTDGGEKTRAFVARVNAALANLGTEEQLIIQALYIRQMTQEEAAEAVDCDPSTVSRRKRRALEKLSIILYPDQYLQENGLHM